MLRGEELEKVVVEFLFWEKNYPFLCINKKVENEDEIPNIQEVMDLLEEFKEEYDYYSIMHRRAMVRKKIYESFLENIN